MNLITRILIRLRRQVRMTPRLTSLRAIRTNMAAWNLKLGTWIGTWNLDWNLELGLELGTWIGTWIEAGLQLGTWIGAWNLDWNLGEMVLKHNISPSAEKTTSLLNLDFRPT